MEDLVQYLLREIQTLRQEMQAFQRGSRSSRRILEAMLQRRGIQEVKYTSQNYRLLPEHPAKDAEDALYQLMQKYSFRIFARDLIAYLDHATLQRLARYCSEEVAREYLAALIQHRIVHQIGEHCYQLTNWQVINFGDTLEWFVAQVMEREFDSPAIWGVRFKHHEIGGDYDVLSAVEGRLTYIEVKSSPPKHIEMSEVAAFLNRVQNLRPDIAIFLEDTHLRMKDKLARMFAEEMRRRYGNCADQTYPVQRLHDEVFTLQNRLFLINTKPDMIANLRICLKHALAGPAWPSSS